MTAVGIDAGLIDTGCLTQAACGRSRQYVRELIPVPHLELSVRLWDQRALKFGGGDRIDPLLASVPVVVPSDRILDRGQEVEAAADQQPKPVRHPQLVSGDVPESDRLKPLRASAPSGANMDGRPVCVF